MLITATIRIVYYNGNKKSNKKRIFLVHFLKLYRQSNDYVIDYVFIYLSNIQPYLKYSQINQPHLMDI